MDELERITADAAGGDPLAAGALPFLGSFTALLVPVTLADLGSGHVDVDRAVAHLLLLVGVTLVATLAWRAWRRRTHAAVGRTRVPA